MIHGPTAGIRGSVGPPKQALFKDARTESMTPEGEVAGLGSSEVGETQNHHETLRNVRKA